MKAFREHDPTSNLKLVLCTRVIHLGVSNVKQSYIVMVLGKLLVLGMLVWDVHWTSVHEACAWRGINYDYGLQNMRRVRVFFFLGNVDIL